MVTETQTDLVKAELRERFPILSQIRLSQSGAADGSPVPSSVLMMLSTLLQKKHGAICIILPENERFAIALAVASALHSIRMGFEQLELERLTTPIKPGQLVHVAPGSKVYEFVVDNKRFPGCNGDWFGLKNPRSGQISYHRVEEQFRLTPTDNPSPAPGRREKPAHWSLTPLDRILDIRTGGNLAIIPNQVALVAPRSRTRELVSQAQIGVKGTSTPLLSAISWGRVGTRGELISEDSVDGDRPPIIAVTHSVDLMAVASRGAVCGKTVIVSGVGGLVRNLQAFDEIARRHRLVVLADHGETSKAAELADRGAVVWAPQPEVVLTGRESGGDDSSWMAASIRRARNAESIQIKIDRVTDEQISALATEIQQVEDTVAAAAEGKRLLGSYYRILTRLTEWLGTEGTPAREMIIRQVESIDSLLLRSRQWIPAAAARRCENIHAMIRQTAEDASSTGAAKQAALIRRVRIAPPNCCVVTRSSEAAARVNAVLKRADLERAVYPRDSLPDDTFFSEVVLLSWPGRDWATRITSQYRAPRVTVMAYDFEAEWSRSFTDRWQRHWTRFSLNEAETQQVTGIESLRVDDRTDPVVEPADEGDEDPIARFLDGVRKGDGDEHISGEDARECYYVSFVGSRYAYLTETYQIPVLTDLVRLSEDVRSIPRRPLRKLNLGDYVLFRDTGDSDVIALIAARQMGESKYAGLRAVGNEWRKPLRSIGATTEEIHRRLTEAGLRRSRQTIRLWLSDLERIGPGSLRDLKIIAEVSADADLKEKAERIHAAIRAVRGAHIQAGSILSNLLLTQLPDSTWEMEENEKHIDLGFAGGWVVCIDDIAEEPELRLQTNVNRLHLDQNY